MGLRSLHESGKSTRDRHRMVAKFGTPGKKLAWVLAERTAGPSTTLPRISSPTFQLTGERLRLPGVA
jgi:hypothetical protein